MSSSSRPPLLTSPSTASYTFEQSLISQATETAWKSFGSFAQRFSETCDEIDERNKQFLNLLADSQEPDLCDEMAEYTEMVDLFQTCGNMELNKLMLVFAELCREMNSLSKAGIDEFVYPITLYGEDRIGGDADQQQDLADISSILPLLYDLLCYTTRCYDVAANLTLQLEALFSVWKKSDPSVAVDVNGIRFDIVFESLSRLSVTLVALDMAVTSNNTLKKDLVSYKRMIELASSHGTSQFGIRPEDSSKIKVLREICCLIERDVMDSYDDIKSGHKSFFSKFTDAIITASASQEVTRNSVLCDQFATFIKNSILEYESESNKWKDATKWLSINCMFVIYVWLFKKDDKKLLKILLDSEKKTNTLVTHLAANTYLFPDHFLSCKLPKGMIDKRLVDGFNLQRDALLSFSLDKDYKSLKQKVFIWLSSFEKNFSRNDQTVSIVNLLTTQMQLLEEGYEYSLFISNHIKTAISLHLHYGKAVNKKDLIFICKLVNLLKSIEVTFQRKKAAILLFQSAYAQYHSCVALKALSILKKRLVAEVKKYSEKKLDMISAVILACNCFHGPILTPARQIISSLCISMVIQCMNDMEMMKILPSFNKIVMCSKIMQIVKEKANCDFLFFNRSAILSVYFSQIDDVRELRYFFYSLSDSEKMISRSFAHNEEKRDVIRKKLIDDVYAIFKSEYLDSLCKDFETELRMQTHLDLKLEDQSPFKRKMRDFTTPLACQPIRFFDRFIRIPEYVAGHLNEMSYNLTTIALHDWKTYESMLNMARMKFGLSFVKSQLPTQTVEQGLDVLEITRNIHLFVTKFSYNLNNQIFVEKSSDNKHLNVLFIRHVANSIQTHGYGIINTAVNFTYQFLRKKLNDFSQFLYEEHVKSRLIKDLRLFREQKSNQFPYDRAERFVKGIRKLGITSEGHSYLDKFRILLTEIGNALGFVRMLRSGALHCSSSSVNFIPDLDDMTDIRFHDLCLAEKFDGEVLIAATNLDTILSTLSRNFSEATDYFKLLLDVFSSTLRDQKNAHLKNMHVVVPALTISYVEHVIVSKEKMNRKNATGAAFTNDGFAVGVAYILRLLDQVSDFESLHWFQSVREKVSHEKSAVVRETSATSSDERFTQTTSLTLKRLSVLQKEFDLLEYSMTSCKILFRT